LRNISPFFFAPFTNKPRFLEAKKARGKISGKCIFFFLHTVLIPQCLKKLPHPTLYQTPLPLLETPTWQRERKQAAATTRTSARQQWVCIGNCVCVCVGMLTQPYRQLSSALQTTLVRHRCLLPACVGHRRSTSFIPVRLHSHCAHITSVTPMRIVPVPVHQDNYAYLLIDTVSGWYFPQPPVRPSTIYI
jgi:hypothetical protein